MASTIAAAPVFVDHQEQESSSSNSVNSTSITIPANEQCRRNNESGNWLECWRKFFFVSTLICNSFLRNFAQNSYMIFSKDFEEYSNYYMVEALIILVLCGFLYYAAYVPRKLYIMKNVSIICGIMFILDLVMIAIIVDNKCYSTNQNGIIEPQPNDIHCKNIIINPIFSSIWMFLSSFCTLLIYYLFKIMNE